ncbi:MAG: hypothetical protein HQ502_02170 [Alphaproteobacteria bacterium]|nr:hypothetical protein [Alphaproteobacteria bacterium]
MTVCLAVKIAQFDANGHFAVSRQPLAVSRRIDQIQPRGAAGTISINYDGIQSNLLGIKAAKTKKVP